MALTANPKLLIALVLVIVLVVSINWVLFNAMKIDPTAAERSAKWSQAFRGGAQARQKHESDLDELHRRVAELKTDDNTDG